MGVIDRLARALLPRADAARRRRWASPAPVFVFRGRERLLSPQEAVADAETIRLLERAAARGVTEAQLALARIRLTQGEHADFPAAVRLLEQAGAAGDAEALNLLGRCHEQGQGTEADPAAAADCYARAAALGHAWAMFNLADLCGRGHGVPRDDAKAYGLYAAAAEKGHVKSLNMLGLFHEEGRGVAVDRARARALFEQGAEGGDCWAQFNLARLLAAEGEREAALGWIARSLENGFPDFWRAVAESLAASPQPEFRRMAQAAAERLRGEGWP